MSKRKIPESITKGVAPVPSSATDHELDILPPTPIHLMKKVNTSLSESEVTLADSSATNGAPAVPITAKIELQQRGPPHTHALVPESPPRLIKKGSPADAFLMTRSPTTSRVAPTEVFLTCDLCAVPTKDVPTPRQEPSRSARRERACLP